MSHYCTRCKKDKIEGAYPYHSFNIYDKTLKQIKIKAYIPKNQAYCHSLCEQCFKKLLLKVVVNERMQELEEGFKQGFMSCINNIQNIKNELEQYMKGKNNLIVDTLDVLIKSAITSMVKSSDELNKEQKNGR